MGRAAGFVAEFPLLWPGIAVALAPFIAFAARATYGEETGRGFTTAFLQGGTALALLASARRPGILPSRVSPWLAALAGGGLLAALASGRPLESLPGLSDILTGVLAFVLILRTGPAGAAGPLAAGLAVGGTLAAAGALWQSVTGIALPAAEMERLKAMDPGIAAAVGARVGEGRAFGPFETPGALACFLVFALPAAVERFLRPVAGEKGGNRLAGSSGGRWAWGAAVVTMVAALPATGSIGAMVALMAALVAAFVAGARIGRHARLAIAAGCVILFVSVVAGRPSGAGFAHARAKVGHWIAALCQVPAPALLLGAGPGSYGEAAGGRMEPGLASRRAHNWLVETVVEDGVLGAAGLAGAVCILLCRFPSVARGGPGWGLAAGWLAWLVQSLVDFNYSIPALVFPWWVVAGMIAASPKANAAREAAVAGLPRGGPRWSFRPSLPAASGPWLVAAVVLATTLTGGVPSALLFGAVLGTAAALEVRRRLGGNGAPSPAGAFRAPGSAPWTVLGLLAVGWAVMAPAPGPALRVLLEAAGLAALALSVRRMGEGAVPALTAGVATVVAGHGAYAVVERVATGGPAYTSFPSPGFLAAFLSGGAGLCAWTAAGRKGRARAAFLGAAVLAAGGVYATQTAAGMLALGVAAVAGVMAAAHRSKRIPVWAWAGIVAAILLVFFAARPGSMSVAQRAEMWTEAVGALRAAPLGSGPGTYAEAAAPFRRPSVTSAGIGRYSLRAPFAHCEPLQFAVEWGVPARGAALWALLVLARLAVVRAPAWGLFIAGPLAYGLFDFPLRAPPIEAALAVACGAILALGSRRAGGAILAARRDGIAARRDGIAARMRPAPRGDRIPVPALVWIVAAWAGISVLRPALSRLALSSPAPGLAGAWGAAVRAKAAFPAGAAAHILEGQARWMAASMSRPVDGRGAMLAEEAVRRGISLAPSDSGARVALGEQFLERSLRFRDRPALVGSGEALCRAVALDPTWVVPRLWLVRTRMAQGRPGVAAAELAMILDLEPSCLEAVVLGGMLAEGAGDRARARREYSRALVMRATLGQRPGPNPYELELIAFNEGWVRGRLMEMGE